MASFPNGIKPHRILRTGSEFKNTEVEFENGYKQVFVRRHSPIEHFTFVYHKMSLVEFEILLAFFNARCGNGETWTFTDTRIGTYTLCFANQRLSPVSISANILDVEVAVYSC